jgi:uncharacterized protein YggU (UPF0235/DUF167 family)
VKFLKRKSGAIEKQYRLQIGAVPIAYRSEPNGRYLYVLDNSLTTGNVGALLEGKPPVPPCIQFSAQMNQTKVCIELEDRGSKQAILKISADAVRVQLKQSMQSLSVVEELLDYMRLVLGAKLSDMSVEDGDTPREKLLVVTGMDGEQVFDKLYQESLVQE